MPSTAGTAQCCRYCQRLFLPTLYCPGQMVCSHPGCQRRRRREYHRQKLQTDAAYRQVCRDSQQKWRAAHPLYQKQYRQAHPAAVERNRQAQQRRDRQRRLAHLEKNNLAWDLKRSAAEVWLLGPGLEDLVNNNVAFAKVLIFQAVPTSLPPCPAS